MSGDPQSSVISPAPVAASDVELRGMMRTDNGASPRPIGDLIDEIVAVHHVRLRQALSPIGRWVDEAREGNPGLTELNRLRDLFTAFRAEVEAQLSQEEELLFPMIRRLLGLSQISGCHAGMVTSRIRLAGAQQGDLLSALSAMHDLAALHLSPRGPCEACHALLAGLDRLTTDWLEHDRLEREVLFPLAITLEAALAAHR